MHTFVTSFIDLNHLENRRSDKKTSFYLEKGLKLLSYPYNFIVFVDEQSKEILEKSLNNKKNVTFYTIDMKDLPVCKMIDKDKVSLPINSNPNKDTYNYMALMISKTYFVDLAIHLNPYNSSHFSWIDLGILHIIKDNELDIFLKSLEKINSYRGDKIRIPGCIEPMRYFGKEVIEFKEYPCWAFCGGFFSGDMDSLLKFSEYTSNILNNISTKKFITWEVNIWTYIYCQYKKLFDWYLADHNITMLSNF
jgi:hypothetical protein